MEIPRFHDEYAIEFCGSVVEDNRQYEILKNVYENTCKIPFQRQNIVSEYESLEKSYIKPKISGHGCMIKGFSIKAKSYNMI